MESWDQIMKAAQRLKGEKALWAQNIQSNGEMNGNRQLKNIKHRCAFFFFPNILFSLAPFYVLPQPVCIQYLPKAPGQLQETETMALPAQKNILNRIKPNN